MISMWKNDMKRLREIMIVFLGLFFIDILIAMLAVNRKHFGIVFLILIVFMIFVVVIKNFEYLHDKTKATHMMSLPFTSVQILIVKYLSGLCALLIPISIYYITHYILMQELLAIMPVVVLILIYYSLGCLIGVVTGNSIMHGFLLLITTLVPILLYMSLLGLYIQYVKGVTILNMLDSVLVILFPFRKLMDAFFETPLTATQLLIYIGYIVCLCMITLLACKNRPIETTGKGLAYPRLDILIKLVIITCFSWIITSLFIQSQDLILLLSMHAFITMLLSILTQLNKEKKIHVRYIIIQTISISLLTVVLFTTTSNRMEQYIPNRVESVSIWISDGINYYQEYLAIHLIKDNSIEDVKALHKTLIEEGLDYQEYEEGSFVIEYVLDNGDVVNREYYVDAKQLERIITQLNNNAEFLDSMHKEYEQLVKEIEACDEINILIHGSVEIDSSNNGKIEMIEEAYVVLMGAHKKQFQTLLEEEIEKGIENIEYIKERTELRLYKNQPMNHVGYFVDYKNGPVQRAYRRYEKLQNIEQKD